MQQVAWGKYSLYNALDTTYTNAIIIAADDALPPQGQERTRQASGGAALEQSLQAALQPFSQQDTHARHIHGRFTP
jgi:hypothetical protein